MSENEILAICPVAQAGAQHGLYKMVAHFSYGVHQILRSDEGIWKESSNPTFTEMACFTLFVLNIL